MTPLSPLLRGLGLVALLIALLAPPGMATGGADADRPQTGLLWLRSDLPAVFPLQVKTAPGRDYHLTLRHHETGQATLAAFITGGNFFRVLVPPGRFAIRVAYGTDWQDEDTLFGPGTEHVVLEGPFRFGVQGIGRKSGHLIDLRDVIETREAALTEPLAFCQSYRADLTRSPLSPPVFQPVLRPGIDDPDVPRPRFRFSVTSRLCD